MQPVRTLSPAALFFFEHAGWSYDSKTQTQAEGRTECAERLAEAEEAYMQAHRAADVGCEWQDDADGWAGERSDRRKGYATGDAPESIEQACIWHRDEAGDVHYLASLCGIWDADANYRRVVRAELASEALDDLRRIAAVTA